VVMIAQQQLLEWAWHPERSSFPSVFELQGWSESQYSSSKTM
jgi:hypothetical protein